jgi:glucose-6-phosphate 1-epimerase
MIKISSLQTISMVPVLLYTAGGAQCTILREGANLVSWIPANGEEQLFISRCSGTVDGLPVRGGIPLVFPQFAEMGPLPKHGILRNVIWDLIAISSQPDCATATLQTEFRAYALPGWPHPFRARLVVELQDHAVFLQFSIHNTGTRTFAFQSAMHTYLRLPGGTPVDIHGCIPANYFDKQLQTWCGRDACTSAYQYSHRPDTPVARHPLAMSGRSQPADAAVRRFSRNGDLDTVA